MKKYLYLTAALAIVGAVSCNKEISDNTTPDAPEVKLATLTATIGEPGTKTTLDNPSAEVGSTTRTFWCKDDKLSVFDGVGNVEYEIKDKDTYEAADEAVFEGEELAEAEGYYALYPYTEAATLEDGTIKGAVLPANQTAVAGNIPEGAALAAAYTEDRSEVYFKNVATTIGFTLTEPAGKVEFIAKGGEDIAGTIDITFNGEGLPTYTVQDGTGSNTVTLTDLEAGTYYFTILPDVTLSQGYELKIDDVLAKTGAVGAMLTRSMIYSLTTVAPLAERNLAFSEDAVTATYGEDFTEPVLSGVTDGVTYESSNTEVATVDPSTGEVTLLAAGTTTITASAPANFAYFEGETSYTLTVLKASSWKICGVKSWDAADYIMMYEENNLAVAKNVSLTTSSVFKLTDGINWMGLGNIISGQLYYNTYNGSNMKVSANGNYDIYISKDFVIHNSNYRGFFFVLPAGTDLKSESITYSLTVIGNNLDDTDLTFVSSGYFYAKNVNLSGWFKVRANNDWTDSWGTGSNVIKGSGSIIYYGGDNCTADSGTYDVYTDLNQIWIVEPGTVPQN